MKKALLLLALALCATGCEKDNDEKHIILSNYGLNPIIWGSNTVVIPKEGGTYLIAISAGYCFGDCGTDKINAIDPKDIEYDSGTDENFEAQNEHIHI